MMDRIRCPLGNGFVSRYINARIERYKTIAVMGLHFNCKLDYTLHLTLRTSLAFFPVTESLPQLHKYLCRRTLVVPESSTHEAFTKVSSRRSCSCAKVHSCLVD